MDELSYICITDPQRGLQECEEFLRGDIPQELKVMTIKSLGLIAGDEFQRKVYSLLIRHIHDEAFTISVIQSLGKIGDTRGTFGLMNYFRRVASPHLKRYILGYFAETQDPRVASFLQGLIPTLRGGIEEIAQFALKECENNALFAYGFCGSDDLYAHALSEKYVPIPVTNQGLTERAQEIEENRSGILHFPQTYIIDTAEGKMYVGGQQNEHVVVANGKKVAGAGEIIFERKGEEWRVKSINNRSYGYYPDPCSFTWVKRAFEKTDVAFDKTYFDEAYPRQGFDDQDLLDLFTF